MSAHERGDDVSVQDDVDGAARLLHDIAATGFDRFAERIAALALAAPAGADAARRGRAAARPRRRRSAPTPLSYDAPLHVVRGEGA